MAEKLKVAVIGHTGRGNYGHGLDTVWRDVAGAQLVAVADAHAEGLVKAVKRLDVDQGFADYRKMLETVQPDLVSIGPRWVDQHLDMVLAATSTKSVKGIYIEKPMARTVADADEMVKACEQNNVKMAVAHKNRYAETVDVVRGMIWDGKIGQVTELRGRGKEDRRGGGEDLWVLGSHIMSLVNYLFGYPKWCSAHMYQDGKLVTKDDVYKGNEGLGPLAGNSLHALYRMPEGVNFHFDSIRECGTRQAGFSLQIHGSAGSFHIVFDRTPLVYWLPEPIRHVGVKPRAWVPVSSAGAGKPERIAGYGAGLWQQKACHDLISSIQDGRQPECGVYEGRVVTEMICAVFESHRLGRPVDFPLSYRDNGLKLLADKERA